jgi:hypothetical protein
MAVDADARIRLVTDDGCETIELEDVPADAKCKARGKVVCTKTGLQLTIYFLKVKASPAEVTPPPADSTTTPAS